MLRGQCNIYGEEGNRKCLGLLVLPNSGLISWAPEGVISKGDAGVKTCAGHLIYIPRILAGGFFFAYTYRLLHLLVQEASPVLLLVYY